MEPNNGLVQVAIQTLGTLHPNAITTISAGLYYDLGGKLRNPHHDPAMRYRNGLEDDVREHVLSTPGAMQTVERIALETKAVLHGYANPRRKLVHVTIACRGGRHRSVAIAEAVAQHLALDDILTEVYHQDIDKPVVENQS